MDRDNYTQVKVREEVNVKIDCSVRRQNFILSQRITNVSTVSIQWLLQQQLPTLDGFGDSEMLMDGSRSGRYN